SDALAVAERETVARFDGLAPGANDRQVRALERRYFPIHVHEVHPGVQLMEQPVGGGEHAERLLVAAHRLVEQGELSGRLGLVEHGPRTRRELDRGAEPRLGESVATGVAVYHADHTVGVG